jgi:uncharacterized membrane protein YbaN (DUF454 family)
MNKRPRSITVISWIFIAIGSIGLLTSLLPQAPEVQQRVAEFRSQHPFQKAWLFAGPVMAIICGTFMLLRFNWARWLLVVWFGVNVLASVLRSPVRSLLVAALFALAVYFLFRQQATAYFRGAAPDGQS